jgi:phosphoglycerate kinase
LKDGVITNDNRIVAALPTIKKLIENGGRVILCSHLGKPRTSRRKNSVLAPVAVRLSELLGKPVVFANDDNVAGRKCQSRRCRNAGRRCCAAAEHRFPQGRNQKSPEFSKDLADLGGYGRRLCKRRFWPAHRAHCSTAGVTD